jgi:dipeptidyl-peptidase 4
MSLTLRYAIGSLAIALFTFSGAVTTAIAQETKTSDQDGIVSNVKWSDDGKSFEFSAGGKKFQFDLQTQEKTEIEAKENEGGERPDNPRRGPRRRSTRSSYGDTGKYIGRPSRGRQYTQVESPDGNWTAEYRDWNLVLVNKDSMEVVPVTTDGNEQIHYGTASWVYGEELNQTKAMWWTADSKKVLYYRFDDTDVKKFYLVRGWSEIGTEIYPEYYPKAGANNPVAELWVYDLESKESKKVEVSGSTDGYIYNVRVSPDGAVMMVNWTDRLQQHLRVLAIETETGDCRTIVEERQESWQSNSPDMLFLKDNNRFLWPSDKTGFTHYELRDLDGNLLHPVTQGDFQVASVQVMEDDNLVSYVAHSSKLNPYFEQYHMVGLDGQNPRRVTTLEYHHSAFNLSPDKQWLIAQYEDVNTPPCTALYKTDGTIVATIAASEKESAQNLAEMFQFKSSDGKFDIYGVLYKPKDFDPTKKYPVINSLYGGPGSREFTPQYVSRENRDCQRGYLVVKVNNRGTYGRGKAFSAAQYLHMGDVDIQDHADAIRLLRERPYFDGDRVGIYGHSYGGYMAVMGIVKHPDVYAASVMRAGVSDWRNYDTIYTERYMSTPQLNKKGYDTGSAMKYVKQLKGKLFIMHGMMDDNVHPNNAFQLIEALDAANKPYESRFWPNAGHGLGRGMNETQWEFFDRVLKPGKEAT